MNCADIVASTSSSSPSNLTNVGGTLFFNAGEGYRVTTASSANDARAKLLGLHFDLLILDVMMPKKSGYEVCETLRAMPEHAAARQAAAHQLHQPLANGQPQTDPWRRHLIRPQLKKTVKNDFKPGRVDAGPVIRDVDLRGLVAAAHAHNHFS